MNTRFFDAFDDDGKRYTIRAFKDSASAPGLEGPGETEGGLWRFETSEGHRVYVVEKGMYRITGSGIILHSDSPDAP